MAIPHHRVALADFPDSIFRAATQIGVSFAPALCQIADMTLRAYATTGLKNLLMALQQNVTHFVDDARG
jgi:hypothetical protein